MLSTKDRSTPDDIRHFTVSYADNTCNSQVAKTVELIGQSIKSSIYKLELDSDNSSSHLYETTFNALSPVPSNSVLKVFAPYRGHCYRFSKSSLTEINDHEQIISSAFNYQDIAKEKTQIIYRELKKNVFKEADFTRKSHQSHNEINVQVVFNKPSYKITYLQNPNQEDSYDEDFTQDFVEIAVEAWHFAIIMPYIEGVPLCLVQHLPEKLSLKAYIHFGLELIKENEKLLAQNIIHLDLHELNILVKPDLSLQIIDFDLAATIDDQIEKHYVSEKQALFFHITQDRHTRIANNKNKVTAKITHVLFSMAITLLKLLKSGVYISLQSNANNTLTDNAYGSFEYALYLKTFNILNYLCNCYEEPQYIAHETFWLNAIFKIIESFLTMGAEPKNQTAIASLVSSNWAVDKLMNINPNLSNYSIILEKTQRKLLAIFENIDGKIFDFLDMCYAEHYYLQFGIQLSINNGFIQQIYKTLDKLASDDPANFHLVLTLLNDLNELLTWSAQIAKLITHETYILISNHMLNLPNNINQKELSVISDKQVEINEQLANISVAQSENISSHNNTVSIGNSPVVFYPGCKSQTVVDKSYLFAEHLALEV